MTDQFHSPASPLGLFSDFCNHGAEFFVKIREKEENILEVLTPDEQLYMTIVRRENKRYLYDEQGVVVLNVRNRTLNFGGEYQVSQYDYMLHQLPFLLLTGWI